MRRAVDHRFFTRVLATLLIIGLLPILVLTTAFYVRSRNQLRADLNLKHQRDLETMVHSVERLIYQISDSAHQVIADPVFEEFEQFPGGNYFEGLRGPYSPRDLVPLQDYLEMKEACVRRLMSLRSLSEAITSVYYYDVARGVILTDLPYLFQADSFYDLSWRDAFFSLESSPRILDTAVRRDREGHDRSVITLIHRPLLFQNRNSGLVVNLDADLLFALATRQYRAPRGSELFVYSSDGARIMPADAPREIPTALDAEDSGIAAEGMLVDSRDSDLLGWRFVARVNEGALYAPLLSLRLVIFITAFLVAVVVILATVISSRHLYGPVQSVLDSVRRSRFYVEPSDTDGHTEIDTIGTGFKRAVEETRRLSKTVTDILPAYRERCLRSLAEGSVSSEARLREMIAYLDLELVDGYSAVLVVSPAGEDSLSSDPERRLIGAAAVLEQIDTTVLSRFRGVSYPADGDRFVVLLNSSKTDTGRLFQSANELIRRLHAQFGTRFTVGIGSVCEGLLELSRSYREAVEALEYRSVNGEGVVVYYDEVRVGVGHHLVYPVHEDAVLRVRLKHGDGPGAIAALDGLLAAVERREPVLHRLQLEQLFLRLLSNIAETLSSLGVSSGIMQRQDYYQFIAHENEQGVIAWLRSYLLDVASTVAEAAATQRNHHVEEVERYLSTHYRNATLQSVSDELGLSPAHVSRIFKESTGRTFMEYLTAVRIRESKRLLQGDGTMQEIAEGVGYSNANYFIRLFKRAEGVTPGEFRELVGRR